ncbi:hypothetical protein [uncultured Alteromonas sp.]|jgi:hypothetical protein|uniref:hypothetical protein n=1 Tax=uncultured Alteromonas sp. TaxID=179113 RepID=UPI0025DC16CD|nr:hypothetical protein [uncultured Alteromonas sp.]
MKNGVALITRIGLLPAILLGFSTFVHAQSDEKPEDIEIVDVVGQRPLSYYRKQLVETELAFYDMYNALTDVKEFKIRCRIEKPSGSHIARKVCYPQYELSAIAHETQIAMIPKAQDTRGIIEPLPTSSGVRELVKNEKKAATEHLIKLLTENPGLREQYQALIADMTRFKQAKNAIQQASSDD